MSVRDGNLLHLVTVTCDTVADVLDVYREHASELPDTVRPRLLDEVKQLLATLQMFEKTLLQNDRRIYGEVVRAQGNVSDVLNDCGLMGKRLQLRISRNALRDDTYTLREITSLRDQVARLTMARREEQSPPQTPPPAPDPPSYVARVTARPSSQGNDYFPSADNRSIALDQRSSSQAEDEEDLKNVLDSLIKENQSLKQRVEVLESNDQSKLFHIKRLHAAAKYLGMRHPMRHRLNSWEELTDELPHIIEHLDSVNELLKDLEQPATNTPKSPDLLIKSPTLTTSNRITIHSQRMSSSEPSSPRVATPVSNTIQVARRRSPSPAESVVSAATAPSASAVGSATDHAPRSRKVVNRSDKRRSAGVERRGFWNS